MSICVKCNHSIKPASLATTVAGEKYHPTCISCSICEKPIWGKPFKRDKDGKLVCEQPCQPAPARPSSALRASVPTPALSNPQPARPSSAQRQQQQIIIQQQKQQIQFTNQKTDLKQCRICAQSVVNKRYITYENGDILCQECNNKLSNKIPRIKSAHYISCSVCNNTVKGTKYYTEANGDIICEKCDLNAPRCTKCQLLFKFEDVKRNLENGMQFHEDCFDCSVCNCIIGSKDFFQAETGLPMCLNCYEISKLPKCASCSNPISGAYIMIDNKPIHNECFKCTNCSLLINKETGFFRNKETGELLCSNCNLKLNGAKCARCNEVIEKEGVTYADKDYHQICFKCDKCGTELVKMKKTLTDKENKALYCEPCFIQSFAPRCHKCGEPITPYLPGTVYEDHHYHKECFACGRCKKTLANKKFFKSGNLLICEQCF